MIKKPRKCRNCEAIAYEVYCNKCKAKRNKEAEKKKIKQEKLKEKDRQRKFNKSTLMQNADLVFSLFIRLKGTNSEGYGTCVSSNKRVPWSSIDCGHYIPRGYIKYRYDERNCHVQSKHDNSRLHGNIPEYRRYIINTYGEEVEQEIFLGSKEYFKPEPDFFLEIIHKYIPEIKHLLKQKTFSTENYLSKINLLEKIYVKNISN